MRAARLRRLCAVFASGFLTTVVVFLAYPSIASAHDHLVSSNPAAGARLTAVPGKIVLHFEEPPVAGYTKVRLVAPSGKDVSAGGPATAGSVVTLAVKATAATGAYTVQWSVLSDDGHPVAGAINFSVVAKASPSISPVAATVTAAHHKGAGTGWLVAVAAALVAIGAVFGLSRLPHRSS